MPFAIISFSSIMEDVFDFLDFDILDNPLNLFPQDEQADLFNDIEQFLKEETKVDQKLNDIMQASVKHCPHSEKTMICMRKRIVYFLCEMCYKKKKSKFKGLKFHKYKFHKMCVFCSRSSQVFELKKDGVAFCYAHMPKEAIPKLAWEPIDGIIDGDIFSYLCIK
jgi:hypothetical protein